MKYNFAFIPPEESFTLEVCKMHLVSALIKKNAQCFKLKLCLDRVDQFFELPLAGVRQQKWVLEVSTNFSTILGYQEQGTTLQINPANYSLITAKWL